MAVSATKQVSLIAVFFSLFMTVKIIGRYYSWTHYFGDPFQCYLSAVDSAASNDVRDSKDNDTDSFAPVIFQKETEDSEDVSADEDLNREARLGTKKEVP